MKKVFTSFSIILLSVWGGLCCAVEFSIRAQPEQVSVGEPVELIISLQTEGKQSTVGFPEIEGLKITGKAVRQSLQTNRLGAGVKLLEYVYQLRPQKAGVYTIDHLYINQTKVPLEKPITIVAQEGGELAEAITLKLNIPNNRKYYALEPIPLTITLILPQTIEGATRNLNRLDQEENVLDLGIKEPGKIKHTQNAHGQEIQEITWNTYVKAKKAGTYNLQYVIPMDIVEESSSPLQGLFGGPFQSFFGNILSEVRQIDLKSEELHLQVYSLPQTGAPKDFSGALGEFTLENVYSDAQEVILGDPITLRFTLKGRGNLNAIKAPALVGGEGWKIYEPQKRVLPNNPFGTEGTMEFEYIIAAQTENLTETPVFVFNFFNPETGEYEALTAQALPVTISAPKKVSGLPLTEERLPLLEKSTSVQGLHTIALEETPGSKSALTPLFLRPLFWVFQLFMAVGAISLLYCGIRRKRNLNNPAFLRQSIFQKKFEMHKARLEKALQHKNLPESYAEAKQCILVAIEYRFMLENSAQTLSYAEISALVGDSPALKLHAGQIKTIFEGADWFAFSGETDLKKSAHYQTLEKKALYALLEALHETEEKAYSGTALKVIVTSAFMLLLTQPAKALFQEANAAYLSQDFPRAERYYLQHIEEHGHSFAAHYNLGNTYFERQDFARAILHYKKALWLSPLNSEARANLEKAWLASGHKPESPALLQLFAESFSANTWTLFACAFFWLMIFTVIACYIFPKWMQKIYRTIAFTLLCMGLVGSVLALVHYHLERNLAIILEADTPLHIAPGSSSQVRSKLPAGALIYTQKRYGDFTFIKTGKEQTGWIKQENYGTLL